MFRLFSAVEQADPAEHPGRLDIPGDKALPLHKGNVVNLLKTFQAQLTDKCLHVSVEGFLGKQVLEGETSPWLYHPQSLPHHVFLDLFRTHLVEYEVAHHGVETAVREV